MSPGPVGEDTKLEVAGKKIFSVKKLREKDDDDDDDDDDGPAERKMEKPATEAKKIPVIYISSDSSSSSLDSFCSDDEDTPSPIICLKQMKDMKRYEETEDCFILDFDPTESIGFSKLSISKSISSISDDNEFSVIAETGKVACRDYPHSRHLCVKFPFNTTSHELHCQLCYCYVCDSGAPCKDWTRPETPHCDATDNYGLWSLLRRTKKEGFV